MKPHSRPPRNAVQTALSVAPFLSSLVFVVLLLALSGCSAPGAVEIDESQVRSLLENYLPKVGEAYAEQDPKIIAPWAVPKEVARIGTRIEELEIKGQYYVPTLDSFEVVSISPWNYSNAFVTTLEIWDVTAYTMGTDREISQVMGQKSRVKYQLKRKDAGDGWVVLYRELDENLES